MAGGRQQEFQEALAAGHALAWDGHWVDAAEAYRRATTLEPRDPVARAFLAMAVARATGPAAAIEEIRQIDAQGPVEFLLLRKTADLAVASGLSDEASSLLLQVGESLWQRGRQQDAIECWQQAVAQAPSFVEGRQRLAHAFNDLGEFAAAAEQLSILERREQTAPTEAADRATETALEAPVPVFDDTAAAEQPRGAWTWGVRGTPGQPSEPTAPSMGAEPVVDLRPAEPPPAEQTALDGAESTDGEGPSSHQGLSAQSDGLGETPSGETSDVDATGVGWESRPASWSFGQRQWRTSESETAPEEADAPPEPVGPPPETDATPTSPPHDDVPAEPPSWLGRIWGRRSQPEPATETPMESPGGEEPFLAATASEQSREPYLMESPVEPSVDVMADAPTDASATGIAETAGFGRPAGEASEPDRHTDRPSEQFHAPDVERLPGVRSVPDVADRIPPEVALVGGPVEQPTEPDVGAPPASQAADEATGVPLAAATEEPPREPDTQAASVPQDTGEPTAEAEAAAVPADQNQAVADEANAVRQDRADQPRRSWWRGLLGARADEPEDESVAGEPLQAAVIDDVAGERPQEAVAEIVAQVVESASEAAAESIPAAEEEYAEVAPDDLPYAADVVVAPEDMESPGLDDQIVEPAEELAPVPPPEPPWLAEWQSAVTALEAGEVVAALGLQEEVVAQALLSGDGGRLLDVARAVPGLGQHAYRELSDLQGRDRAEALLALTRGAVLLEVGRVNAAVQTYEDLISAVPDFLPVQIELARALALSGRPTEAREKLEAVATVYDLRGQGEIAGLLRLPAAT